MIASLTGTLVALSSSQAIIECNGVGYEVSLPSNVHVSLPNIGAQIRLYTSLIVRADAHNLYGFLHTAERDLFNILLRVNGVGPKSALGLLSALDPQALAQAVQSNDARAIKRAPGIGPKSANRILMELRDNPELLKFPAQNPIHAQAVEALIALGFAATRARATVSDVQSKDMDVTTLIKAGLAKLSEKT